MPSPQKAAVTYTGTLYKEAAIFKERLDNRDGDLGRQLAKKYRHHFHRLQVQYDKLYAQVAQSIEKGETFSIDRLRRVERYGLLMQQVQQEMVKFSGWAAQTIGAEQEKDVLIALANSEKLRKMADKAALVKYPTEKERGRYPGGIYAAEKSVNDLFAALNKAPTYHLIGTLRDGTPLHDYFLKGTANVPGLVPDVVTQVRHGLEQGLMQGWSPRTTAKLFEQALGVGLTRSLAIARTETLRSYREAARYNYTEHGIQQWEWLAGLDEDTCACCCALDGQLFPTNTPQAAHVNCRCTMVPYREGRGQAVRYVKWPDEGYMVGTGKDWFAGLNDDQKLQYLGQAKFNAWNDGALQLVDLVAVDHHPVFGYSYVEPSLKRIMGEEQAKKYYAANYGKAPAVPTPAPPAPAPAPAPAPKIEEVIPPKTEEVIPPAAPEPVAPAAPPPIPQLQTPEGFPVDPSNVEFVKDLGGTTGAQLVRDKETGALYVLKRGKTPDHIRSEAAADAAYRAMGVKVPEFKLYETRTGPVKLARYIPDAKSLGQLKGAAYKRAVKQLQKGFAADAILANWDVVGLDLDNILIDKEGTVWRIDNGGALFYRAQGEKKSGMGWSVYPTELWTMRDQNANRQTAGLYGDLDWFTVNKQMKSVYRKREAVLGVMNLSDYDIMQGRFAEFKHLTTVTDAMQKDGWIADYVDGFAKNIVQWRQSGIINMFPEALTLKPNSVIVKDKKTGREWDNLRGKDNVVGKAYEEIEKRGGNRGVIRYWAQGQASSSNSENSLALKWFMTQQQTAPVSSYYWGSESGQSSYTRVVQHTSPEVYKATWQAWHSLQYEFLQHTDFKNNHRAAGWIQLMRTESSRAVEGLQQGETAVIRRGVTDSTSIFKQVSISNYNLTVTKVPHHRVIGTYMFDRDGDGYQTFFYGDSENEVVAMLNRLPTTLKKKASYGK